ncbi:MAG: GNAT family N-acetyltransferase [Cyclobacteriaceae bacterium]
MLETNRLSIEEALLGDADFFFRLLNSPNWIEYIGDRGIKTLADAERYIQNSLINSYRTNGFGLYKLMLRTNKQPIGICGFLKRNYLDHPDLGFAILPEYERHGYTFEAAEALMDYGKSILLFKTTLAITTKKNTASKGLLEKLGMKENRKVNPSEAGEELLVYSN